MQTDTQVGSGRQSGGLNYFYGALLLGFLWPIILLCLVLSLCLVHLRTLPRVQTHLSAKMDSSQEAFRKT